MKESVIMRECVMMRECDDEGCMLVLAAEEERRTLRGHTEGLHCGKANSNQWAGVSTQPLGGGLRCR
jgi:hypothetical protein